MNETKRVFKPLQEAASLLGGQTAIARICTEATGRQIKQGHVSNWLSRDHSVPADCAKSIEAALKQKGSPISAEDLCPSFAWHLFEETAA